MLMLRDRVIRSARSTRASRAKRSAGLLFHVSGMERFLSGAGEQIMEYADEIALRRVKMMIEQYVLARRRAHDFVSTEQACRAIRRVVRSPIEDVELDHLLAESAIKQGLSIRFDRIGRWQEVSVGPGQVGPVGGALGVAEISR